MADPRYTDQAHALAVAIHDATCHDRTCPATVIAAVYGTAAVAALDHLTRRGLLLEPGGETETYWAVIGEDAGGPYVEYADDEDDARHTLRIYATDSTAHVARRTVHTGPWQPVEDTHA